MGKLDGKVALITGAGSGIGRATALLFAKEGSRVAVADYVPAGGEETVSMIKETGGEAIFIEVDVSKASDVERMVKAAVDKYGRIDILHNNAGITPPTAPTADTTEENWDSVINANLKGVFLGSKYVIPVMIKQGGGVIINTASGGGLVGTPGLSAYGASKGGVIQLTKAMALEYAKQNIRVNSICPGAVRTPMSKAHQADIARRQAFTRPFRVPLGRMGQPEEIAKAALYLACDDSSYVTGAVLVVDGGVLAD
jgi:NAD(P)-dependent dehydrogenase (short-subunit alcohol dehydrogenase family)